MFSAKLHHFCFSYLLGMTGFVTWHHTKYGIFWYDQHTMLIGLTSLDDMKNPVGLGSTTQEGLSKIVGAEGTGKIKNLWMACPSRIDPM